jgi:glycosyltransferase involved in cell wall biosynthesis
VTSRIDVLVVASWYPSIDDGTAGRFVADQAAALAATGRVDPRVVTFNPALLTGGATSRTEQDGAISLATPGPVRDVEPVFVRVTPRRGTGDGGLRPGVPVARLTIAEGNVATAGTAHAAVHRRHALHSLADRLAGVDVAPGATVPIVHAHTGYPDGAAAIELADALDAPLVITEHASFVDRVLATPGQREAYLAAAARASRVIAVSETLARELQASIPDLGDRLVVVPNVVAVEEFRLPEPGERIADELVFVGYRKASKGIEALLRAFARVHAARPRAVLRLIGSSPTQDVEAGWQRMAEDLGIAGAVRLDPPADREGVAAALRRASLFVHPSPRETFGVVAVEALASGLPVVAADSGGVTEILGPRPGQWGWIVPPDDAEALADGILAALEAAPGLDPADLRAAAADRFSSANISERLVDVYADVLGSWHQPRHRHAQSGREDSGPPPSNDPESNVVVVALDRARAIDHLARLPDGLAGRVILITTPGTGTPRAASVLETVVASVPQPPRHRGLAARRGPIGRVARVISDPAGTIRRRLARSLTAVDPAVPVVAQGLALARATSPRTYVVALDGQDHLAVLPFLGRSEVFLVPGGLRRLVDLEGQGERVGDESGLGDGSDPLTAAGPG